MDKKKLNEITDDLITSYFRNPEVVFSGIHLEDIDEAENLINELLECIASLHNELYKEVTGSYYDYMFHWVNKVTGGMWEHLDDRYKVTGGIRELK